MKEHRNELVGRCKGAFRKRDRVGELVGGDGFAFEGWN
jgi:hypothetical protein